MGRRLNRRERRLRKEIRDLMEVARAFGKGTVWSALFLVLLAAVSGMVVMVVAGTPMYAVFFLPAAVLAGLGLRKWEGR